MKHRLQMTLGRTMSPSAAVSSRWRWRQLIPAAILLVLLGYILRYPDMINHDCAFILSCAQVLSHGGLPYVDFIDVNPPLVFYVNLLPVAFASVTGLGLPLAFSIFVFVLLLVSTVATAVLLRNSVLQFTPWMRTFIISVVLLFSLFVYASGEFGQREHLFAIVLYPWFWCRLIRYDGGQVKPILALLVGIMTGIGACLKPHFVMIVFFIELVAMIERKNFKAVLKPEALSMFFVGLIYGLHFLFLPSIVKEALFGRWIPFFRRYYGKLDIDLFSYYLHHRYVIPVGIGLLLLCLVGFAVARQRPRRSLLVELAFAAFIASVAALWIQHKGASYHLIPPKLSLILILTSLSIWWYEENSLREGIFRYVPGGVRSVPVVLVAAALLFFSVKELVVPSGYYKWYEPYEPIRKAILEHTTKGDRVMFLSDVHAAYPILVQVNRLPGSRYLWDVPSTLMYDNSLHPDREGRFPYRLRNQMPREEVRILDDLAEDIILLKPKLIFLSLRDTCKACPKGFRISSYLIHAGLVDKAMKNYAVVDTVSDHAVYIRQDAVKVGLSHDN